MIKNLLEKHIGTLFSNQPAKKAANEESKKQEATELEHINIATPIAAQNLYFIPLSITRKVTDKDAENIPIRIKNEFLNGKYFLELYDNVAYCNLNKAFDSAALLGGYFVMAIQAEQVTGISDSELKEQDTVELNINEHENQKTGRLIFRVYNNSIATIYFKHRNSHGITDNHPVNNEYFRDQFPANTNRYTPY